MFSLKRKKTKDDGKPKPRKPLLEENSDESEDEQTRVKRLMYSSNVKTEEETSSPIFDFDTNTTPEKLQKPQAVAVEKKSKYIGNLLEAKRLRDEDKNKVKQQEKENMIKNSNISLIFDSSDYQSSNRIGIGKTLSKAHSTQEGSVKLSNQDLAEKYGISYEKLETYIKSKLSDHDIESYRLKYNQRMTKS